MKKKTRKLSIRAKIMLSMSVVVMVLIVMLGLNSYNRMNEEMISMGVEQAKIAAKLTVQQIDGDEIKQLQKGDESTELYRSVIAGLRDMKEQCGVKFLYTLTTDGKQVYYGVDTDTTENQASIGDVFEFSYEEMASVFGGNLYAQEYITSNQYGDLISVYAPIKDSSGKVVAVLGSDYDAANVVERLEQSKKSTIEFALLGLFAVLAVIGLIVTTITKNINKVNEKLYELVNSEGDLTKTLLIKTGDETELMAENVNALLAYIREIMMNVSKNTGDLNESAQLMSRNLSSAKESIMDVSATMEEMSAAMEETAASLNQVTDSVAEAYDSADRISEQAAAGDATTKQIQEKAQSIYKKADSEQTEAYRLAEQMAVSMNEKIEQSKSVQEINVLTENIIEITEQTNLLALNASIEAARAGEAGRGFAVVASEIGKLATDSAAAAAKIKEVSKGVITSVEGLAAEAEEMILFMEETAMKGYRDLLILSEDYQKEAKEIHTTMGKFADNSEKLKGVMNGIRESVRAVDIAVEESAKGIVGTTETAVVLTENIADIEQKAVSNRQVAGELESEVGKFKLE